MNHSIFLVRHILNSISSSLLDENNTYFVKAGSDTEMKTYVEAHWIL